MGNDLDPVRRINDYTGCLQPRLFEQRNIDNGAKIRFAQCVQLGAFALCNDGYGGKSLPAGKRVAVFFRKLAFALQNNGYPVEGALEERVVEAHCVYPHEQRAEHRRDKHDCFCRAGHLADFKRFFGGFPAFHFFLFPPFLLNLNLTRAVMVFFSSPMISETR